MGFALFEIPSNLFLEKISARKTFARITILWGVTSIATMTVKTATWFYILRFLLGSFEAGLFPGVVLYLTYWFPARRRAQMVADSWLPSHSQLSSGSHLRLDHGIDEQWGRPRLLAMAVRFGLPSMVIGLLAFLLVADEPAEARWLSEREKQLVFADLEADQRLAGRREHGFGHALKLPRVWLLAVIQFCANCSTATIAFWVPSIIQGLGVKSTVTIGILSAMPYFRRPSQDLLRRAREGYDVMSGPERVFQDQRPLRPVAPSASSFIPKIRLCCEGRLRA
jgi:MFS family permease